MGLEHGLSVKYELNGLKYRLHCPLLGPKVQTERA